MRRFYLTMRICGVVRLENVMDSALLAHIASDQEVRAGRGWRAGARHMGAARLQANAEGIGRPCFAAL